MENVKTEWAIESILVLLRLFRFGDSAGSESVGEPVFMNQMDLAARLVRDCPKVPAEACRDIAERVLVRWLPTKPGDRREITFADLREDLLPGMYAEDARYHTMRWIRNRYGIGLSSFTVAAAHRMARTVSKMILASGTSFKDLATLKAAIIERLGFSPVRAGYVYDAFFDLCLVLGILKTSGGEVYLSQQCTSAEYLMNHLFGLPTRILGFDALFGGGGLMLTDYLDPSARITPDTGPARIIGGRSIVCIGPVGSGKTLISLNFAVEVARKGGVAWVMSLEQTEEECLFALESIGISTRDPGFRIFSDGLSDSFLAFSDPAPSSGALVFLRPTEPPEKYLDFLETTESQLEWMARYPLRLLIVDPIGAFSHEVGNGEQLRSTARRMFETAKSNNVNVWFTSEQYADNRFEEKIADTVVHVASDYTLRHPRRYIEIRKSRFQEEAVGRHALTISSWNGIHIYPSSALVASSSAASEPESVERKFKFGVPGADRLLGEELIRSGDLIAIAGPGKGKSLTGAFFLFGGIEAKEAGGRALIISDYTRERTKRLLDSVAASWVFRGEKPCGIDHIDRYTLPTGYADPERILFEIQAALEKSQVAAAGGPLRVLLSNLSRWEEDIPFVKSDPSFALALIRILRSHQATSVVVCGDVTNGRSMLTDAIIDHADIHLQFNRFELQGRATTLVSVGKSRFMRHQRESFELSIDLSGVKMTPAPLFRIHPSGEATPVPISLFLHAETDNHKDFNKRITDGLRATLSPNVIMEAQDRRFDPNLLSMSQFSAVDELQIFQIDEFQLPPCPASELPTSALYSFDEAFNKDLRADRLPELYERVRSKDGRRMLAVPFYTNLSFFSIYQNRLERAMLSMGKKEFPKSWKELAQWCHTYEAHHRDPKELLFSCPVFDQGFETYNCLYFEILSTYLCPTEQHFKDLSSWLKTEEAVEAAQIFWRLCRKGHRLGYVDKPGPEGIITRHWYNTLNQALSKASLEDRNSVQVRSLFGDITTAGEWYLAIPSHSASPEIGLRLIEYLTALNRETQRVELGVGLPTRESYYTAPGRAESSISRSFHFSPEEVRKLFRTALRRSRFRLYHRVTDTISTHLRGILDLSEGRTLSAAAFAIIQREIGRKISELARVVHFLAPPEEGADPEAVRSPVSKG